MTKKQKGISPDGTELLDFSSNPFPTYYRHQDGDKQIKMRGHVDQDDTEITIVLPRVSGSLAIIGDGGTIDLSDYYTKGEVESLINDLDVEIKNDYYDKTEIDKLLADFSNNSDELQAQLDALEVLIAKNSDDISKNAMDISLNTTAISDNADDIKANTALITTNKNDIEKNKKDISELKAQVNAGKDKASQYVWKEPTNYEDSPDEGDFYAGNGVVFVDEIKLTEYIYMSKIDDDVVTHNLDAIEKGDVIEADLGGDNPAHGVFEVDSVEIIGDTHAKIKVIPIRTAGNWSDQNKTSGADSWSMSFMLGLEVEASNYYSKTETDNLFTTKTDFENHAKLNVASFALVEKEIVRVTEEVLLNYEDIKKNEEAIEDKASKKYVDDAIEGIPLPDLSDYATINYVDNAIEGIPSPDLSGYMPLDGNSTKTGKLTLKTNDPTPFSIKAGNGTPIVNVWASGAISLEKSYNDFKDNELVSKKYVDDSIEGISAPDLSDYMTEAETVEFVDSMDKLNLASANANAKTYDRELKEDLEGQIADAPYLSNTGGQLDGALTIKKATQVALDIVGDNNNSQIKFWSSGAIAVQNYTGFKDNELVTKKYVDDKVSSGGGFTAGDAVAKTNGESTNVGGFWISNGNLYCKVS